MNDVITRYLGCWNETDPAARFTWGLGPEGAEPLIVGFDVAVTDDDGKLVTVLGFPDKVPS